MWFMVCHWPQSQEGDRARETHLHKLVQHGPLKLRPMQVRLLLLFITDNNKKTLSYTCQGEQENFRDVMVFKFLKPAGHSAVRDASIAMLNVEEIRVLIIF